MGKTEGLAVSVSENKAVAVPLYEVSLEESSDECPPDSEMPPAEAGLEHENDSGPQDRGRSSASREEGDVDKREDDKREHARSRECSCITSRCDAQETSHRKVLLVARRSLSGDRAGPVSPG